MRYILDIDIQELTGQISELNNKVTTFYKSVNIDELKNKCILLQKETENPNFWNDMDNARKINQQIGDLKKRYEPWVSLVSSINDSVDLLQLAASENDKALVDEINQNYLKYTVEFDKLQTIELLSNPDDKSNCFVTIHPGAGGTESQDWAQMLMRMYLRWCEAHDYGMEIIDYQAGEEAGIKTVTIYVKGDFAYGFLKSEMGVHRLVRISPFDANKRRHTSFASVEVAPETPEDIDITINDDDLRIDTYRSSGAGGQHVNKTDSAVRLTHLPTGIVVQCQNERSQHKNKDFAMKVLKSRLYELKKQEFDDMKNEKLGEKKDISWGNQIRSYVFQPYMLVKDHRTNEESGNIGAVMDGGIDRFIEAYLKKSLN